MGLIFEVELADAPGEAEGDEAGEEWRASVVATVGALTVSR